MARRLFPGAWLRKPHSAQVGRSGAAAGARPSPQSSLRSGRPPQGSRRFPRPGPARPPLPSRRRLAAAGARLRRAAARPAGGGGAGHGRRVSGHGSRWRRPRGRGASRRRPDRACPGAGPVTRRAARAPRAHGGAATPAAPPSPALCSAPPLYTDRPRCSHPCCPAGTPRAGETPALFCVSSKKLMSGTSPLPLNFLICS